MTSYFLNQQIEHPQ